MLRRWTPEEEQEMIRLEGEGLTCSEIGARLGRTKSSIHCRMSMIKYGKYKNIKAPKKEETKPINFQEGEVYKISPKGLTGFREVISGEFMCIQVMPGKLTKYLLQSIRGGYKILLTNRDISDYVVRKVDFDGER